MEQGEIDYILRISGFKPGVFPFRYLGVPISHKRMGIGDCTRLIEKVVSRIRSWGAKKLSYAGRLVLIKAVLSQLHSYWSRIFVIPLTVIDRIERICRNYLWSGSDQYGKSPNVNWDNICKDKKHGGLGIVNSRIWNTAVIGKYTSWMAVKSDHLWLRWVCHIYMKGRDWYAYTPTVNSSWTWRKICQVMGIMKPGFITGIWAVLPGSYSVATGYKWLLGQQHPVIWYPLIWNRTLVPRHAFVGWLLVQGRLMTRDRLVRFGITTDMACAICSLQNETHQHLFSECTYYTRCWDLLTEWLGMSIPKTSVVAWYTAWRCPSLMKKQIIGAAIIALWYHVWNARNIARIEDRVLAPRVLLRKVKQDIQGRCQERKWSLKMTKLPWEPVFA